MADRLLDGRGLRAHLLGHLLGDLDLHVGVYDAAASADLVQAGEGGVEAYGLVEYKAVDLAVLGDVGEAVAYGVLGALEIDLLALHVQLSGDVGAVAAAEDAHGELGAARALQAGEADDLALVDVEGDVVVDDALLIERVVDGPVPDLEADLVGDLVLAVGIAVLHRAADHAADYPLLGELVHALDERLNRGAVADYRGLVGAVDNLVELVGDDYAREALLLELYEQVEQHLRVLVVEGAGGLVEYEQAHLLREGLGYLDELLLAGADVLYQGVRVLPEADLAHVLLGLVEGLVPVDNAELVPELVAHEHILAYRKQRNKGKLLVDDNYADGLRILEVLELAELAVIVYLAIVAAHGELAAEHVHQRALAGAVFTYEGVYLALLHHEVDVVQRLDAGEFLRDGAHFKQYFSQTLVPPPGRAAAASAFGRPFLVRIPEQPPDGRGSSPRLSGDCPN